MHDDYGLSKDKQENISTQQPLMTAVIAEDHGKLFFSGLTDPNSEQMHD
ncbi:hypothetical protein ACQPT2_03430 [Erwinia amylovora]